MTILSGMAENRCSETYPAPIGGFASLDSPHHVFAADPAKEG
jgi:hypothetical protein